jgi:DNA-binding transcriptional LysR family regulator
MNWDDLRVIAAIREAGSFAGASARLRIDETTVARRLGRLERGLGVRLFEAADGARKPTAHCEALLAHVQAMATHVAAIAKLGETSPGPVGRFRIASTNAVAEEILSPRASLFLAHHPGLTLQFSTSGENVRFSRWEADLAIRLRKPEKGDFAISKLADIRLFLIEPAIELEPAPIICSYPEDLDLTPEAQFLKANGLQQRSRCVTGNVRVIRNLILTHRAVGVLPEYLCADLLADRRLRATPLPRGRDAWLLVQNHLKRDQGARMVIDWVRDCFQQFSRA